MSALNKPHNVGRLNSKPDFGISQDRLDWTALKAMKIEDREREIVKRANFILQLRPWGAAMSQALRNGIEEAVAKGSYSFEKPTTAICQSVEKLQQLFPFSESELEVAEATQRFRKQNFTTVQHCILHMDEILDRLRGSQLCKRLMVLMRPFFASTNCCRVVAFGLGPLTSAGEQGLAYRTRIYTQTASMIILRDLWKEYHVDSTHENFQIFLQDTSYWQEDVDVAKHYNMQVVNGQLGHQMGWLHVNNDTLVCNFASRLPLCEFILEFARPIAFLSDVVWDPDSAGPDFPYSYSVRDKDSQPLIVPDSGLSPKESYVLVNQLYSRSNLNQHGLDVGSNNSKEEAKVAHTDGSAGENYLGYNVTLYILKTEYRA